MTSSITASDFRKGDVFHIKGYPGNIGTFHKVEKNIVYVYWASPGVYNRLVTYDTGRFTGLVNQGYFYRVNRAEPFTDEEYEEFFV